MRVPEKPPHVIQAGILFCATGDKHAAQARSALEAVRRHMPDTPVYLYTDRLRESDAVFDKVILLDQASFSFEDKVRAIAQLPFERNVFLDTDTLMLKSIEDLFDLLGDVDMAAIHDTQRWPLEGCPDYLPEPNTGVLAIRRNARTHELVSQWHTEHRMRLRENPRVGDQLSLRAVLSRNDIRYFPLPSEYNFTIHSGNIAGFGGTVRILHGRADLLGPLSQRINQSSSIRHCISSISSVNPKRMIGATRSLRFLIAVAGIFQIFANLIRKSS